MVAHLASRSTPPQAPVLLLAFNRPEPARRVFDAVRRAAPARLYIAVDGPRPDRPGEAQRVETVRGIVTTVDWDCEVKTLFRDENSGCRIAVSSAIDWFFEHEAGGIILEDDCLPDPTFFQFCNTLLQHYAEDERIMTISGDNYLPGGYPSAYSYYFSRYMHCWGWATWRRAWKHFDASMTTWPAFRDQGRLAAVLDTPQAMRVWTRYFNGVYEGSINSWAYAWQYAVWLQNGLNILPRRNLVSNIGFGAEGTHTSDPNNPWANMPSEAMAFPLVHPPFMIRSVKADTFTQRHLYQRAPLHARLMRRARILTGRAAYSYPWPQRDFG